MSLDICVVLLFLLFGWVRFVVDLTLRFVLVALNLRACLLVCLRCWLVCGCFALSAISLLIWVGLCFVSLCIRRIVTSWFVFWVCLLSGLLICFVVLQLVVLVV